MPPMLASTERRRFGLALLSVLAVALLLAQPAQAVRVLSWNILNYPGSSGDSREDDFRVVLPAIQPDLIVVQEITTTTGSTEFLNDVLNVLEPGQWALAPFINGPDTDNACYYKTAVLDLVSTVRLSTALRDINGYVFTPDAYSGAVQFRIYSLHLKASTGSDNEAKRLAEAQILRNHLEALPSTTHIMVGGDFNIYTSTEPAWGELTGSQANNEGRLFDPINRVGNWHNSFSFADVHTQSTRTTTLGDGGSTGGMDDRFDFILMNDDMLDGEGVDYIPGSYETFGQDGLHFNSAINASPPNAVVSSAMANALHFAADHLPLFADVQMPAKMTLSGSLDFGTVIVGATANLVALVQNPAVNPADELDFTVSAGAGFNAPVGSFSVVPGGSELPSIGMDTGTVGTLAADVIFSGDAPDTPSITLPASGTVLGHAQPSLSDVSVMLSSSVDFGSHPAAEFTNQTATVHNFAYSALQAELELYDFVITGADAARFDVVGFAPSQIAATPLDLVLSFDADGAATETSYSATLTLSTRDEQGLPGATALADLSFDLLAYVEESGIGVPPVDVTVTQLRGNAPNPFNPRTLISYELARGGHVELSVFDSKGRLVRQLVNETRPEGRHEVRFDGFDDSGRALSSGVYFYRYRADGVDQRRKMVLVR